MTIVFLLFSYLFALFLFAIYTVPWENHAHGMYSCLTKSWYNVLKGCICLLLLYKFNIERYSHGYY